MIKISIKYFAVTSALLAGCCVFSCNPAQARDTNDDMHISSPLFNIDDAWPEKEMHPAIEPVKFSNENPVNLTTIRKTKSSKTVPVQEKEEAVFAMPKISTPQDMITSWGYGSRENMYNAAILAASEQVWPHSAEVPLNPILLKSLFACESSFDPNAVSYTGAVGLAQLTPETARRFGLNWTSSRNPNQAIPVGVKVLAEKAKVVIDPANYHKILGTTPDQCPYASNVAKAYEKYGNPTTQQFWHLMLAAYNGGGGTILRAMSIAYTQGKDPRVWANLVGDPADRANTPLYQACTQIFKGGAANKYRELSEYPVKIISLYNKTVDPEYKVSSNQ